MGRRRQVSIVASTVLLCLALFAVVAVAQDEQWEYVGEFDDVDLYQMEIGDEDDLAFRGIIEVDVHIGQVVEVFTTPEERPNWVSRYSDHQTLEHGEDFERYWLHLGLPIFVSDRDFVLESRYSFDDEERLFTAVTESVEDERRPEDDCCIRAESTVLYEIQAMEGEERTRIEMSALTDLKGGLPGWVVRRAQQDWPVDTLNNLVDRAREEEIGVDERVEDWHDIPGDAAFDGAQ